VLQLQRRRPASTRTNALKKFRYPSAECCLLVINVKVKLSLRLTNETLLPEDKVVGPQLVPKSRILGSVHLLPHTSARNYARILYLAVRETVLCFLKELPIFRKNFWIDCHEPRTCLYKVVASITLQVYSMRMTNKTFCVIGLRQKSPFQHETRQT
jgi:hypothetical protein